MPITRIVVLANSVKKGGRCVAGREVNVDGPLGAWVRPISDVGEGELMPAHMMLKPPRPLHVLDIVDVPVVRNAQSPCHPEDWQIAATPWQYQGSYDSAHVNAFEERPRDLWLSRQLRPDQVGCPLLQAMSTVRSLYLIRPERFRIRLSTEHNPWKGRSQKKTRAVFRYRGTEYNLSLTDPAFTDVYCPTFPPEGAPAQERVSPFGDHCLLCVSLTPEFQGIHYKVVATVLRLP